MFHAGLILEGGGMRGVYTAGVLDAFLENEVEFSSVYGVSAGSCHACSYLSKQKTRAFRVNIDYLDDPDYMTVRSFLKTGNLFGVDLVYRRIPDVLYPFDHETFSRYEGDFYSVVTNVLTGEAEYLKVTDLKKEMWKIRASASLPMVSKTIGVHGRFYLDGGIADSIPIRRSIEDGNEKNVIVLTRDVHYRKEANRLYPLMKLRYPGKKAFLEQIRTRHLRYNETLDYIRELEEAGKVFVIRPESEVEVGRTEKNREKLTELYKRGLEDGKKSLEKMKEYLSE